MAEDAIPGDALAECRGERKAAQQHIASEVDAEAASPAENKAAENLASGAASATSPKTE